MILSDIKVIKLFWYVLYKYYISIVFKFCVLIGFWLYYVWNLGF